LQLHRLRHLQPLRTQGTTIVPGSFLQAWNIPPPPQPLKVACLLPIPLIRALSRLPIPQHIMFTLQAQARRGVRVRARLQPHRKARVQLLAQRRARAAQFSLDRRRKDCSSWCTNSHSDSWAAVLVLDLARSVVLRLLPVRAHLRLHLPHALHRADQGHAVESECARQGEADSEVSLRSANA
jgi:hypothetical protein